MSWIRPTDICVVTGGSNGLGREILRAFAKQGCPTISLDVVGSATNTTPSDFETDPEPTPLRISEIPTLETTSEAPIISAPQEPKVAETTVASMEAHDDTEPEGSRETKGAHGASERHAETGNQKEIGDSKDLEPTLTIKCDVRNQEDLESARQQILKKFDRYPSIVVLNAGIRRPFNSIAESDYSDLQDTLDVNLGGVLKCIRTFLPDMIEGQRGFLISVASALGIIVPKGMGAYGASKAGIIGIHDALRQELLAQKDIHTMLVCPGQLATTMFSDVQTPSTILAPIIPSEKLAAKIVKRVKKANSSTVYAPYYVRYLQLMNSIPVSLAQILRKYSGVDQVYDDLMKKRISQADQVDEVQSALSDNDSSCSSNQDIFGKNRSTECAPECASDNLSQPEIEVAVDSKENNETVINTPEQAAQVVQSSQ